MQKLSLWVVTLLLSLGSLTSYSQYTGATPTVNPVSPNSAALFKAIDRPAGSFTGTTPISIPLCKVNAGDIDVPVAMTYNNGGIKLEEVAGSVGLGWNMSMGGRITRVLNGVADDQNAGDSGYLYCALKPSAFPTVNLYFNVQYVDYVLRGWRDLEPDMFYFDCNGISGKFYFDEQGNVRLVEQMPITIQRVMRYSTYEGNHIVGWILTDNNGTRYYFGTDQSQATTCVDYSYTTYTSRSSHEQGLPSTPPATSAWHLLEIRDMNNENVVRFSYDSASTQFTTLAGAYARISGAQGTDCTDQDNWSDVQQVTTYNNEKYLKKIASTSDSLMFYSSANRVDFAGAKRIDSLKLYTGNGTLVESYHLNYNYFSPTGADPTTQRRLKLNSISQFGSTGSVGTDSMAYQFTYIEDVNLPSRLSFAKDYWGYYNGRDMNSTALPNGVYNGIRVSNQDDQRSNGTAAAANTLKRITWPMGGYRDYIYEGNQALIETANQIVPDANYYVPHSMYTSTFNTTNGSIPQYQQTFTVNSKDNGSTFGYNIGTSGSYGSFHVNFIKVLGGGSEMTVGNFTDLNKTINLDNGNYRVEFWFTLPGTFTSFAGSWSELQYSSAQVNRGGIFVSANNISVGGIRVKEVRDYDPVSGKTTSTKYKYNLFSNDTLTSGLLISPVIVAHVGSCPSRECIYTRLSSSSQYPLSADGGSYVVYPEVRTIEDGNGFTDREFSFAYDATMQFYDNDQYPTIPWIDSSWLRGKPVIERHYNESKQLLSKSSNVGIGYHSSEWQLDWGNVTPYYLLSTQKGWKISGLRKAGGCDNTGNPAMPPCAACWDFYTYMSHFDAIKGSKETSYTAAGGVEETLTEYDYYNLDLQRTLLKEKRVYLSDGSIRKTRYRYAFNKSAEFVFGMVLADSTIKASLLSKNYQLPIEVVDSIKSSGGVMSFASGERYYFGLFNTDKLHLARIRKYSSPTDYKETNFTGYDANGNLLEQYQTNDVNESYLWGYNNQYPVAVVRGSTYSAVASYPNAAVLNNPASDLQLQTELNKIRTGLGGSTALVTTYTYSRGIGMSSLTDPMGRKISYSYDAYGRLQLIKDQDNNILKKYCYNYLGQAGNCSVTGNAAMSVNITRNDCGPGYAGTAVPYNVPANKYFGNTLADANAQAQAEVNMNGQANANAMGTCKLIYYNVAKSGSFTRACSPGYVGTTVTYTVNAGADTSTISQADADQKAQNDVNANGQNYANTYGACNLAPVTIYTYLSSPNTPYIVKLTNTSTGQVSQYNVSTGVGLQPLATVPVAAYIVNIFTNNPVKPNTTFTVCFNTVTGQSATFYGIAFSSNCYQINIQPGF
jgi:YD repeat-containing protein